MLCKVVLHGSLRGRFPEFAVDGGTVEEVLEGWSRQSGMEDIPTDQRPIITVLNHETEAQLRGPARSKELHLFPAMFGGGGFGKILMGAVMIGLSFIPGIGQAIQAAMIISGATTILSGVVQLFMKAPSLSKSEDPDASKYIGTGKNTTKIGTLIGIGGGRMMAGGQFLSLQVNAADIISGTFPVTPT